MDSKPAQKHKIMREVLEARGCAFADTQRIHSDLRAAYHRLLPSIERTCSELSTPDRLQRIDLLEIDLGVVPLEALESAVVEKFDRVFADRLAAALDSAESTPLNVDLELFSYFIRTGTVPWWADRSDRRQLETRLGASIRRAPRAFRRVVASVPDPQAVWRRIALAYPDWLLDEVLGVLVPPLAAAYPGLGTQWVALIETAASGQGYSKSVARTLWWEELLRASYASAAPPVSEARRFFEAILRRLANRLGLEYGSLVANLHRTLDHHDLPVRPWARDVVGRLHQDARSARDTASAHAAAGSSEAELERLLARCEESRGRLDDDWVQLRALLTRLPSAVRARALPRILRTPWVAARLRESAARRGELTTLLREAGDSSGHDALALEIHSAEKEPGAPLDLAFSDADEIYVENAGLVILWPFLESFFGHLGLLEEKQFRDPAARQRAIGLLQYVVTAEAAAPEYLVPLNKVLCGMAVDDVFEFGPEITAREIDACTDLVAAAIHHAPVLRDMSVDGFRGTFLLRRGQLSVRDGNWLLRVERETYDIVLDRFPWSMAIVKLPWMMAIMPVEW
jgi:hypothetical protein